MDPEPAEAQRLREKLAGSLPASALPAALRR
jgi:hypothetical protein